MRKNLVVLGSCVTRDPLEASGLREFLLYYHCRSNLASLASQTAFDGSAEVEGIPPFQRRCVAQDLKKTFRTEFDNCVVIFDFIDDRFPAAIRDGGVFTRNPLAASLNPLLYADMRVVRHFEPNNWPFVEESLTRFAERFSRLFARNITVLHKASFSPFYDGDNPDARYCQTMRRYYDRLFEALCQRLPFDHVIDCMSTVTGAESTPRNHQWGHAPFHYDDSYNRCFSEKLVDILREC